MQFLFLFFLISARLALFLVAFVNATDASELRQIVFIFLVVVGYLSDRKVQREQQINKNI